MKRKSILLILLVALLFEQKGFSQDAVKIDTQESGLKRLIHGGKLAFKINYFGELGLHPGLEIGTDYSFFKRNWISIHWDISIGGYWHRWNNTSLFAKTSVGARFYIGSAFADLNAGIGYLHSFLAGPVYAQSINGGVEKIKDFGSSHFMPNFSLLFGWDGSHKKDIPVSVFIGPEVYFQSHFNHTYLIHIAAKVGVTFKIKKH
jgi:hypothetical protein